MNSLRTRIIDRRITQNVVTKLQSLTTSTSTNPVVSPQEIQIPMRKERGPTDILQALERTISRDPTAADYKYMDDPFLIPSSLNKKRTYSLSKESGKKAAMWILQEHGKFLKSNLSEPLIHAFLPPDKYQDKSQVSEEVLLTLVGQGRVADVIHVYELLEGEVKDETKQAVLEMMCFYNSEADQISENFPEERSYQINTEVNKNLWRHSPLVEKLFTELKSNTATAAGAYNAVISGTAKYLKSDTAWNLYNECLTNNIPLSVTTYNHILQLVPLLKDNIDDRKTLVQIILQKMVEKKVKPNLGTLNATLKTATSFTSQGHAKEFALSLIAEFQIIGVEPCLASYYYLLSIFCRENGSTSRILFEILEELEKKEELFMQDPMDKNFFVTAMEVASKHIHDMSAATRLHKLLLTKNNYNLIGGRLKESVYYRHYLQLVLTSETLDDFMKVYDALVPNVYIPEPALMRDIIEILEVNSKKQATELLPRFLSHVIMFDMLDRHQIMKKAFRLMTTHCAPPKDSPLHQQYVNMAWTLWTHIQHSNEKRLQRTMWPASVFGDMAIILIRGNEFEKMLEVLRYLVNVQNSIIGSINLRSLQQIFDACIERGHAVGALDAVNYANEYGIADINEMAKIMKKNLPLSDAQENQLINLVGVKQLE